MGVYQHPSAELRANYAIGNLAPGAALAIAVHMDFCGDCSLAPGRRTPKRAAPQVVDGLPASLENATLGRWRGAGFGVRTAPLVGAAGLGESIHLLKAAPNARLRAPAAAEFMVVLQGEIRVGADTFKAGDFLALTGVREGWRAGGEGCLCLVVGDDTLYQRPVLDWLLGVG